jgi:hypothetical protein
MKIVIGKNGNNHDGDYNILKIFFLYSKYVFLVRFLERLTKVWVPTSENVIPTSYLWGWWKLWRVKKTHGLIGEEKCCLGFKV